MTSHYTQSLLRGIWQSKYCKRYVNVVNNCTYTNSKERHKICTDHMNILYNNRHDKRKMITKKHVVVGSFCYKRKYESQMPYTTVNRRYWKYIQPSMMKLFTQRQVCHTQVDYNKNNKYICKLSVERKCISKVFSLKAFRERRKCKKADWLRYDGKKNCHYKHKKQDKTKSSRKTWKRINKNKMVNSHNLW